MVAATGSEKGSTEGAKKIDLSLKDNAKGTVRYCQGKDTAGDAKDWVKTFNAKNTGVTVELVEFSPDAGQQRQLFRAAPGGQVRRLRHVLLGRDLDR